MRKQFQANMTQFFIPQYSAPSLLNKEECATAIQPALLPQSEDFHKKPNHTEIKQTKPLGKKSNEEFKSFTDCTVVRNVST